MTVEYVDAGEAINQGELSGKTAGGEIAPRWWRTSPTSASWTLAPSPTTG